MPVANIMMLEGRTKEQKRQLIQSITRIICDTCDCIPSSVTVIIEDIPKDSWGTAGIQKN